jgi:type IV pilus assembly protein PilB
MADRNRALKLGEILLEDGLITHEQLMEALQIQKSDDQNRKIGEILVEKGYVDDKQMTEILADIYQLPYVDLSEVLIDESVFQKVPSDMLHRYKVIPINMEDQFIVVATHNPLDVSAFQEIQYACGFQVKPVMASTQDIADHLEKFSEVMDVTEKTKLAEGETQSVIKLVESVIIQAIKERASDIHLEPMEDKMRVRFRIDGVLYEKPHLSKDLERKVISRIKIVSGMDVADSRRPQDGRMTLPYKNSEYDIRISTLPDIIGENMVMRILDKSSAKFTFESLGMDEEEIVKMKKLIKRPHGMILVTGPTGSGKTTTLYSMLNLLNEISKNIITVEDPVEYRMAGISQTLINIRAGYTFASAIRQMLRHDPDIIMVGEIRDQETAEIAIRAALTGHLVLSTLHTNTAAGAVMRLLDMGIEPFLIRSSLFAVIAQRLVRRLCPKCHKEYTPSEEEVAILKQQMKVEEVGTLASPVGCDSCFKTGFTGRVGIYEILGIDRDIRDLVLKNPNEKEITDLAVSKGMHTLRSAGLLKATRKITSLEEVFGVTFSEED